MKLFTSGRRAAHGEIGPIYPSSALRVRLALASLSECGRAEMNANGSRWTRRSDEASWSVSLEVLACQIAADDDV